MDDATTPRHRPDDHDPSHDRPAGASDATVAAVGKLSEAWEWVERARGRLFDFHQMMGRVDTIMEEAADALATAGHAEESDRVRREVVGRNVLRGRWTFQAVEEFDDEYYRPAGEVERWVRDQLMDGKRHVFESELKDQRRTPGEPGHERRPAPES